MISNSVRISASAAAIVLGLSWNGGLPPSPIVSSAGAVIGAPLTPMSYAGVARRTTRRAVAASAATTAAVATAATVAAASPAPTIVVGPSCVQVVNSYGQVTYRC